MRTKPRPTWRRSSIDSRVPGTGLAVVLVVLMVLSSMGAPLGAVEEGGAGNPFSGNIGNALWTLVIFVGVVVVLGKFAWGPLLRSLQAREEFIRGSLEEARNERNAAQAQLQEYEDKLADAHSEVAAIMDEARRDATVLRHRIEQEARQEAEKIIVRAKREVGIARDGAIKEIYTLSARLATEVASRVVGRVLDPADQERLIQESLDELRNQPQN